MWAKILGRTNAQVWRHHLLLEPDSGHTRRETASTRELSMNARTFAPMGATLLAIGLFSAGSVKAQRPTDAQLRQVFAQSIGATAAFMRISSFRVEASENVGSRVEPLWHTRFRAIVTMTQATYRMSWAPDPGIDTTTMMAIPAAVVVVEVVRRPGQSITVFGRTQSTLYSGQWRTRVELEGVPFDERSIGSPRAAFRGSRLILVGTREEATLRTALEERRRAFFLDGERRAERQRLEAERAERESPARLCALLSTHPVLNGTYTIGNDQLGVRLMVISFEASNGALAADVEFDTDTHAFQAMNGQPNHATGSVSGDSLTLTLRQPTAMRFRLHHDVLAGGLVGRWNNPGEECNDSDCLLLFILR